MALRRARPGPQADAPGQGGASPADPLDQVLAALTAQALSRVAGTPLVPGNRVRLLKDARENYPAWLDAIDGAKRRIHFETYILHDDAVGRRFADALADKARQGVRVRLIHDWMGGLGKTPARFWRRLSQAGVHVRRFNPPRLDDPLGWVSRDHRKMLAVDGRLAFVSGLCVGRMWQGDPARGIEPWRDTGLEIAGPAVADVERAFAQVWAMTGEPLDARDLAAGDDAIAPQGDVALRVIATVPGTMAMYRVDQLVAAAAQRTLWLTDAYFVGVNSYVHALRAAAHDGVDVRLLVPGASDIKMVAALSRAAYRPLLQAGVRVFEWNGPMLHAKTAVADGRWARIGSTNLNLASWAGNCELDVTVENARFAAEVAALYEQDLQHATEVVLAGRKVARVDPPSRRHRPRGSRAGSANRVVAGTLGAGSAVGAVLAARRELGPAEATLMAAMGIALLAAGAVAVVFPKIVAIPLGALGAWFGLALLLKARRLRTQGRQR